MKSPESPKFQTDLAALINRHQREGNSDTPDFILAEYLSGALHAFEHATRSREQWVSKSYDQWSQTECPPIIPGLDYTLAIRGAKRAQIGQREDRRRSSLCWFSKVGCIFILRREQTKYLKKGVATVVCQGSDGADWNFEVNVLESLPEEF